MSVTIKTPDEIEKMRIAGRLGSEVLDYITPFVKAGVSTAANGGVSGHRPASNQVPAGRT